MQVKIFCDSATVSDILKYIDDSSISGFTTNPTLMKKAGITDYLKFAKEVLETTKDKPVSFEVFSRDPEEMKRQALLLSSLGKNVYVKITPLNYDNSSLLSVIRELSYTGVQLNVTAVFTIKQVREISNALSPNVSSIISVFAGRIADAGVDPEPIIKETKSICLDKSKHWEVLWASPREVFNIVQAERSGADIITATPDLLAKRKIFGKDLTQFSLETARMFMDDASSAGYTL
jgi:transaldolase